MWLKPPTAKDICPRKRKTGLSKPPQEYECLIVLDLEWTAWKNPLIKSQPEIIEFGACVVPLNRHNRPLPVKDLQDGRNIHEIQLFCKPTESPRLSNFITELTGITQAVVDTAPMFETQLKVFASWLQQMDLIDENGKKKSHWSMCSWTDADLNVIRNEAKRKGCLEDFPDAFNSWVNLKDDSFFKRTYGSRAKGGLENCCKNIASIGFKGRAHGALCDARNTAALVADMANKLMRFTRPSRGFDKHGHMFGSANSKLRKVNSSPNRKRQKVDKKEKPEL
mmetsp:Transcript_11707/g.13306  ORF Transcript_11707/g.13306 Transcript_11707/m.13306 type:complete len:280 (-) Transcript_11707:234-1073(-)|eukprot:CAMPEP_0204829506 /NCGR_PEP_ID=MMETSP1346-20131115/7726_1 /ASSEMBLY_ACC=CAM_ASM_000771 /TAXON_ID=215587 /ORGANISM="Aplanochytrium stocchinoi, Strain GSBS06" /LENGTH=279 /DNA_ID=CAMNT_0051959369 /DNA_START=88 /DNA_END=927 /DNA_ORIENTATION=-